MKRVDRIIVRILWMVVSLAIFTIFTYGQSDGTNVRWTQGEVNESATLSLGVPFGSYKGRGIDLPVSLSYSSTVWRIDHINTVHAGDVPQSVTQAIYSEFSTAGWKSSLDLPIIEFPKFDEMYAYDGKPSAVSGSGGCFGNRIAKVFIHMPDGSVHELRKSDMPYGAGAVDMTGTFYAVDGSRMRFDANGTSDTGTIYMPDGTKYVLDHTTSYIYDRNGNYLAYNVASRTWTDTIGRTIANPIPASPTADTTTYANLPGLSGVSPNGQLTYALKWKHLVDALTPDDNNQTPSLNYVASHYLPNPNAAPTSSSGSNYPQAQSSQYQSLFHSAYNYDADDNSSLVPTIAVGKGQSQGQLFNPVVLSEIDLPDGTIYQFSYNVYGEINKVIYPTNSYETYDYDATAIDGDQSPQPYVQTDRKINSRKLSIDGTGNDILEWKYLEARHYGGILDEAVQYRQTSIIAPDKTRTEIYKIDSQSDLAKLGFTDARNGMVVQRKVYSTSSDGLGGSLLRRELTQYGQTTNSYTWNINCGAGPQYHIPITANRNPRPTKKVNVLFEGGGPALAQTTTIAYDTTSEYSTGLDQVQSNTYNYAVISNTSTSDVAQAGTIGQISAGSLAKYSVSTYLNSSPYQANNILGLPTSVEIHDSAGAIVSRSEMSYDDSGYVANGTTNALPTTSKTWDSTKGVVTNSNAYLVTHATFDQYGNRTVATDAMGNSTTTTYDSTYHAFPISVTSPIPDTTGHGSNSAFTSSTSFDTTTGLVLSATDANGQTTTMEYIDALLRPTKVTAPNGQQTITEYGDGTSESTRWVKVKTQIDAYNWSEGKTYYDGIGRTYKTQKTDAGGDIYTITNYDIMGRVTQTSNPFRNVTNPSCSTNLECIKPEYDDLSRTTKVTTPDPTSTPTTVQVSYGLSTSGAIGTTKTITDQAGHKRKGIVDALGNMIRVIEDPDSSALVTDYTFDTLGNLRKTTQGSQNRYFMYDSLGKVLYAKQVEQDANSNFSGTGYADPITGNNQWSVKYTYDDNGNIATTTDARNFSISATYDHLNRLTVRDYSDSSMPDVSFYYDGKYLDANDNPQTASGSAKGKTTGIKSSVSRTNNTSFDGMGRLLASQQITDGQTYSFGYTYNLSGALETETYPSTRVVKNTLDTNGKLSQVQSKKDSNHGYWSYADSYAYNPAGAVTKMQLGNGRWETASYNEREQVKMIGLGSTDSTQDLLKLEFCYTSSSTSNDNNGSMREQKITVPTVGSNAGFTATQTYTYDALNRLGSATETVSSSTTWKQTFSYDIYGNRRFDTTGSNTTTISDGCSTAVCNPTISTSNNRFSSGQGYSYDADGSVTQDAAGQRFGYDSEDRQNAFFSSANNTSTPDATYSYDGNGQRVKKTDSSGVTIFVYDASGQLAAEYVIPNSQQWVAPTNVSYLTTDHLGSPRIITDQNGKVTSRKDFTAFGEDVISTQRTAGSGGNGYDPPNVRQDYTGYQKDEESGLEYSMARYYNASQGRFTSPDPLQSSAAVKNPQTLNRYAYGLNSPYKFTDPLGLIVGEASSGGCSAEYSFCNTDSFDPSIELMANASSSEQAQHGTPRPNSESEHAESEHGDHEHSDPPPAPTAEQNGAHENQPESDHAASASSSEGAAAQMVIIIMVYGQPGTGRHNVGRNFERTAATMENDLTETHHRVYNLGEITGPYGFQNVLDEAGKLGASQVRIFSHVGTEAIYLGDGPPTDSNTVYMGNVKKLVNNSPSLRAIWIYGCEGGGIENGIASALAKQLNVTVYASTTGMQFSPFSDRLGGKTIHPSTGPTYMVSVRGGKMVPFTKPQ